MCARVQKFRPICLSEFIGEVIFHTQKASQIALLSIQIPNQIQHNPPRATERRLRNSAAKIPGDSFLNCAKTITHHLWVGEVVERTKTLAGPTLSHSFSALGALAHPVRVIRNIWSLGGFVSPDTEWVRQETRKVYAAEASLSLSIEALDVPGCGLKINGQYLIAAIKSQYLFL